MNPRRDSRSVAGHPTPRGRMFLALILPSLAFLLVGGVSPPARRTGAGITVEPDRTIQVDGILATHEKMSQFEAMLGPQPQMTVIPYLEGPGPLPLPGTAAPAVGPASENALKSKGDADQSGGNGVDQWASPEVSPGPDPGAPALMASFQGVTDPLTVIPPDTHGAVGPAHVVSITNGRYQVFNKAGATVFGPIALQAFWAALGTGAGMPANAPFDPKIIYDQYSGRFIVVTDGGGNTASSWVLMAISVASDPTLGWFQFAFDADTLNPGEWVDFPYVGVTPDNVYFTNNRFTVAATPAFTGAKYLVVTKASMLAGGPLAISEFNQAGFSGHWAAGHAFGPTTVNYIMNEGWSGGGTTRFVRIQRFSGPPGAPVLTDLGFVRVADYSFNIAAAPQSGCAVTIETNDTRFHNLVLRGGRLWTTHTVGMPAASTGTKTEIAWYEIDPTLATPGGTNSPVQQGRVSNPVTFYSFPSIAVNDAGCVALGFAGSDAGIFGSGFYTMRRPADPPGTMQPVGLLKAGVSSYVKRGIGTLNRWGDYSATMIDPADGQTFWTTQEYAEAQVAPFCPTNNTGRYATWWGSFSCGCDPPCGDGVFCNGAETCDPGSGACLPGTAPSCVDGDPCTTDGCDSGLDACVHAPLLPPREGGGPSLSFAPGTWVTTLTWSVIPDAVIYNSYRGTIPPTFMGSLVSGPFSLLTCLESDDAQGNGATTSVDAVNPPVGRAFYWLFDGENSCAEGSLGRDAFGHPIPNSAPCPTPP